MADILQQLRNIAVSLIHNEPVTHLDNIEEATVSTTPEAEAEGSIFDGVQTVVLFKAAEEAAYAEADDALWDPQAEHDGIAVPLFPLGGGISLLQHRSLSRVMTTANSVATPYLSREMFDAGLSDDLDGWYRSLNGPHPIVILHNDIVFDPHSAKRLRRAELAGLRPQGAMMSSFSLRVEMDPFRTGFEEERELPLTRGTVLAGRYEVVELLGQATFSRAVRCVDRVAREDVCVKVINNTKEFFDQSLDEIRLLHFLNSEGDADSHHVVRLLDFFYFREHTCLVTELLSDNLYEYAKFVRESGENYFTLPRLRSIARQIVEALDYVHGLQLIHCDLKPENVMFLSHRRCVVKVIDFGSSCFTTDHLSSYIQSRSYRAPEVILGCDYDGRIDVWSLGAMMFELATHHVLFQADTVPDMLARMVAVVGSTFPRSMLWEGRNTHRFFDRFGRIYHASNAQDEAGGADGAEESIELIYPMHPSVDAEGHLLTRDTMPYTLLRAKLAVAGMTHPPFVDFVCRCLTIDYRRRPSSKELLRHPFLLEND